MYKINIFDNPSLFLIQFVRIKLQQHQISFLIIPSINSPVFPPSEVIMKFQLCMLISMIYNKCAYFFHACNLIYLKYPFYVTRYCYTYDFDYIGYSFLILISHCEAILYVSFICCMIKLVVNWKNIHSNGR